MADTCTIRRVTGQTTDEDGNVTPTYDVLYTGRCRVQTRDPYESKPEAGDHQSVVLRDVVMVPVSVTGITSGDLVETTASALDPDLVGRRWRIAGPSRKTHMTQRRFYAQEDVTEED